MNFPLPGRSARFVLGMLVGGLVYPSLFPRAAAADSAEQQIAELRRTLARHDEAYHRNAAPEISDHDYDQLKRRLATLEREHPGAAQAVPPLAEIGDDRSGLFQTVRHRERMLSLEKAYTEAEIRAFSARLSKATGQNDPDCVVEPKFDGLAVSVIYEHGRLQRAVTRGNGIEGDDVTAHVRLAAGVPATLRPAPGGAWPALLEVRGELFVPFAEFARVNAEREAAGETAFAHPRNLAAGALRQLDPSEVARRGVHAVFYAIGVCEPASALPANQHELPEQFRAWGLPAIAVAEVWRARGAEEILRAVDACRQARSGLTFPIDGAVVKLDSLAQQHALGAGEHVPRWAVAFKFAPERAETRVLAITLQVGRTGVLTPVAELAPVSLGGSTIARATLHNREEIARRDVRVGDTVYLEKAGEIIPAIVGVNLARRPAEAVPYAFPSACPECRAPVSARMGEVAVRCGNRDCPAQLRRRLEHYASKAAVDIATLGPATIDALVRARIVADIADLYRLRREDLLRLGRMNARAADQLLAAIEASKRVELWRVIYGLGIPQIGAVASRELARRAGHLETLSMPTADALIRDDAAGRALRTFLAEPESRAVITRLIAAGVNPADAGAVNTENTRFAGKNFVLTGTLPNLTRAQATEKIQAAGGKVGTSVSRATHYVVAGSDAGAKLSQARSLGIAVIDEAGLLRLLAGD